MDVTRIEGIAPIQVDWSRLTAGQIIEYKNQGIEVPSQYIIWAQNFIQSIESNDSTTYEMYVSKTIPQEGNSASDLKPEDTQNEDGSQKSIAQIEHEAMIENGVSIYEQAKIFTNTSQSYNAQVGEAETKASNIEYLSNAQIEALEKDMTEVMGRISNNEALIQQEINNINSSSGNLNNSIAKINQYQREIEQMGQTTQIELSLGATQFNVFNGDLNASNSLYPTASDYGSETSKIGEEMLSNFNLWLIPFALSTIHTGKETIKNASIGQGINENTKATNLANMNIVSGFMATIEAKTGIKQIAPASPTNNQQEQTQETNETQEANKTQETTSTNSQTSLQPNKLESKNNLSKNDVSTNKLAQNFDNELTTNFDKIILAKIRRGEELGI